MKKLMAWLTAALLTASLAAASALTVFAADTAQPDKKYTDAEIVQAIDGMVNYYDGKDTSADDWVAIGLGRYGITTHAEAYLAAVTSSLTAEEPAPAKATTVLGVLAGGGDPTAIGGRNLIEEIYNGEGTTGLWITTLSTVLAAYDAADFTIPASAPASREEVIKAILSQEDANGGFSWQWGADSTAMVLQALAPYYNDTTEYTYKNVSLDEVVTKTVKQVIDSGLALLAGAQTDSGAWEAFGSENVQTGDQVLTLLSALGIDAELDARFIKNGKTILDGIMQFQSTDGGFANNVPGGESNAMATEQTLYSLTAYSRLRGGLRDLYDMRPEFTAEQSAEIAAITAGINALPGEITSSQAAEVKDLTERHNALKNDGRYVRNYPILRQTLAALSGDLAAIDKLVEDIAALPEKVTTENEETVDALLVRYHALNADYRALVTNYNKLSEAKAAITAQKAENEEVAALIEVINGLPAVITEENRAEVSELMRRYNALSDDAKARVNNAETLKTAEKTLEDMRNGEDEKSGCGAGFIGSGLGGGLAGGILIAGVASYLILKTNRRRRAA